MAEHPAHRYHVLEPREAKVAPSAALAPAPTTAATFYDTQDIAFSRSPGTRAYYQYNHWTDRPQRVISAELSTRFVARRGGPVLRTQLVEMYHDAAQSPGTVRVIVTAELEDRASHTAFARQRFVRQAPATSNDAIGAVAGFDEAVSRLLDDIVEWADHEARLQGTNANETQTEPRRFAHDSRDVHP
jgi:ABC-type uncharacterized transport system auxiliary subunit